MHQEQAQPDNKKVILFYPEPPKSEHVLTKICALLGYTIISNPQYPYDVAVKWKDATVFDAMKLKHLLAGNRQIINVSSLDIRKRTVGRIFTEVFGYQFEVNPIEFRGKIVEKSDRNATHDGRVLDGASPISKIS